MQFTDILVVDDEAPIRRMLKMILEEDGYSIREAASGKLALAEVTIREPQLAILDLRLPDIEGTEVLRLLRKFHSSRS